MLQAYILIQTQTGKAAAVAAAIASLDGVTSVSTLNGPYDVIAVTQTGDIDELGQVGGSSQMVVGFHRRERGPHHIPGRGAGRRRFRERSLPGWFGHEALRSPVVPRQPVGRTPT